MLDARQYVVIQLADEGGGVDTGRSRARGLQGKRQLRHTLAESPSGGEQIGAVVIHWRAPYWPTPYPLGRQRPPRRD